MITAKEAAKRAEEVRENPKRLCKEARQAARQIRKIEKKITRAMNRGYNEITINRYLDASIKDYFANLGFLLDGMNGCPDGPFWNISW